VAAVSDVVPVYLRQNVDHREVHLGVETASLGEDRPAGHAEHLHWLTSPAVGHSGAAYPFHVDEPQPRSLMKDTIWWAASR
jgi:hypothetical protein